MAVLLVLGLNVPLLAGCAGKHEQSSDSRIAFEQQTEEQLRQLDARIAQLEQQRQMLEARLAMQAQRIAALERHDDTQNAQIQALSQALDRHRTAKPTKPTKPAKPAGKASPPPKPASPPHQPAAAPAAPDAATLARKEAEKNAYTAAWLALKGGRFDEARQGFSALLRDYPEGEYADQAWYWLGESQIARKDQKAAEHAFRMVVEHYPKSVKRAAARLRLGDLARKAGKADLARERYERLLKEYPDSPAASQARQALRALTGQAAGNKGGGR